MKANLACTHHRSQHVRQLSQAAFFRHGLPQVPDLEVDIVDDQNWPLHEYEDEIDQQTPSEADEDQRTYEMTRYIESKSGAKFGVCYTFGETFSDEYGIRIVTTVDSGIARKLILAPANLHADGGQDVISCKFEQKDSKRFRRDFQFADLEVGKYVVHAAPKCPNLCR